MVLGCMCKGIANEVHVSSAWGGLLSEMKHALVGSLTSCNGEEEFVSSPKCLLCLTIRMLLMVGLLSIERKGRHALAACSEHKWQTGDGNLKGQMMCFLQMPTHKDFGRFPKE